MMIEIFPLSKIRVKIFPFHSPLCFDIYLFLSYRYVFLHMCHILQELVNHGERGWRCRCKINIGQQHVARIEAKASFILFLMKWCGLAVAELCQKEVMRKGQREKGLKEMWEKS